jgi:hypothetical protein
VYNPNAHQFLHAALVPLRTAGPRCRPRAHADARRSWSSRWAAARW